MRIGIRGQILLSSLQGSAVCAASFHGAKSCCRNRAFPRVPGPGARGPKECPPVSLRGERTGDLPRKIHPSLHSGKTLVKRFFRNYAFEKPTLAGAKLPCSGSSDHR